MDESVEFAISTLRSPKGVYDAVYSKFFPTKPKCLVLAKHRCLEFHTIKPYDASLSHIKSLKVLGQTKSMIEFSVPELELHWIITLNEDHIITIFKYDTTHQQVKIIKQFSLDSKGHQPNIEGISMKIASWGTKSNYDIGLHDENFLIVHTFQGYMVSINLTKWISPYLHDKKKSKPSKHLTTFALGNIIVQDSAALCSADIVAILYRDFDFDFSMRFYSLSTTPMALSKQFESFSEPPHILIAPRMGGVFVMSDLQIYYFTSNEPKSVQFDICEENKDSDLLKHKDCVVKKLYSSHNADFIGETWSSHTLIDDNRVLVMSDTGLTCLLHFNIDYKVSSSRQIIVKSINLIRLGKATVPSSLVHIDEDLFFASSSLSQSMLFKVKPKEPFVDVIQFVPSTPPVLHIEQQINEPEDNNILVCQGCQFGGEVTKVPTANFSLEQFQSYKVSADSKKIIANSHESVLITNLDHKVVNEISFLDNKCVSGNNQIIIDAWNMNGKKAVLSTKKFTYGNESIKTNQIILGQVSSDFFCFAELPNKLSYGSKLNSIIHTNYANGFDQLSNLVASNNYILLTFWSGEYELLEVSDFTSVCKGQVSSNHGIVSASLQDDGNVVRIFLSTTSPSIIVSEYDKTSKSIEYSWTKDFVPDTPPYMFIDCSSLKQSQLLFKENEIAEISYPRAIYTFSSLFSALSTIKDAKLIGLLSPELTVLLQDDTVLTYGLVNGISNRALIDTNLNFRSLDIPNSTYTVVLSSKDVYGKGYNSLSTRSFVRLLDSSTMNVLDEFEVEKSTLLFDLASINCELLKKPRFLVLHSGQNHLFMFEIENSKLKKLSVTMERGYGSGYHLSHISNTVVTADSKTLEFYLSGSLNCKASLDFFLGDDTAVFTVFDQDRRSAPTYSIGSVKLLDQVVVCDALKGFYVKDSFRTDIYAKQIHTQNTFYKSTFITAFDVFIDSFKNLCIIYGDIKGNVVIFRVKKLDSERYMDDGHHKFINIGEPINSIKVTCPNFLNRDHPRKPKSVEQFAVIGTAAGSIYSLGAIHDVQLFQKLTSASSKLSANLQNLISGFNHSWNSPWITSNTEVSQEQSILDFSLFEQVLAVHGRSNGKPDSTHKFETYDVETNLIRDLLSESYSMDLS